MEGKRLDKNKKKGKMPVRKKIGITLISISVVILLIILGRGIWLKYMSQFNGNLTIEQVQKNKKKAFKTGEIKAVTTKDLYKAINWDMDGVIGAIYLPTINTQAMISYGYDEKSMYHSVGTMQENQEMGEVNNYAIAGHNMGSHGVLFTDVQKGSMNIGDDIYLTDVEYVYEYETTDILVVPNTRGDLALTSTYPNRSMVTLVTCTPDGSMRSVVQGDFVKKWKTSEAPKGVTKAFKLD